MICEVGTGSACDQEYNKFKTNILSIDYDKMSANLCSSAVPTKNNGTESNVADENSGLSTAFTQSQTSNLDLETVSSVVKNGGRVPFPSLKNILTMSDGLFFPLTTAVDNYKVEPA